MDSGLARARTEKSCGPGTRCWCQVRGWRSGPTWRSDAFNPRTTVARRNSSPGSTKETVKTIAQGRPVDPPVPVALPRAFCCTRTMGASGTRPSLRPLFLEGQGTCQNASLCLRHSGAHVVRTSKVQLHIGESRDSGFDASHRPGMTIQETGIRLFDNWNQLLQDASSSQARDHSVASPHAHHTDREQRQHDDRCDELHRGRRPLAPNCDLVARP
jgi:hypothetical protein